MQNISNTHTSHRTKPAVCISISRNKSLVCANLSKAMRPKRQTSLKERCATEIILPSRFVQLYFHYTLLSHLIFSLSLLLLLLCVYFAIPLNVNKLTSAKASGLMFCKYYYFHLYYQFLYLLLCHGHTEYDQSINQLIIIKS